MSDVDWIENLANELSSEFVSFEEAKTQISEAYAAHCQASDTDNLAERIADYAVAATHVYGMMSSDPEYLQRLREREEAKKQEMMPHIAEMLAPLLAENERLRAELRTRTQQRDDQDRLRGEFAKRCVEAEAESERRLKLLVECLEYVEQAVNEDEREYNSRPLDEACRQNLEESSSLLHGIDAETGGAK